MSLKTGIRGVRVIEHYEQIHDGDLSRIGYQPKMCPAGIWTVGLGHALRDLDGSWLKGVKGYQRMLEIYPDLETIGKGKVYELLYGDLNEFEGIVLSKLTRTVEQHEFDSLVSHTYNTGGSDTLFRLVNNKANIKDIENWFTKHYITANKKVQKGLIYRRRTEFDLYSTGSVKFYNT